MMNIEECEKISGKRIKLSGGAKIIGLIKVTKGSYRFSEGLYYPVIQRDDDIYVHDDISKSDENDEYAFSDGWRILTTSEPFLEETHEIDNYMVKYIEHTRRHYSHGLGYEIYNGNPMLVELE